MAIYWSLGILPGATSLKRIDFPASRSHQLPIAYQLGWDFLSPSPVHVSTNMTFVVGGCLLYSPGGAFGNWMVCQYLKGLDCEDMAPTVCTQAALCGFPASCAFFPHCSGEVSHNLINWPSIPGPSLVLQGTPVLESLVHFRIILQAPFRLQSTQLPSWADSAGREERPVLEASSCGLTV